jgi:hypothetical protein
MNQLEINKQVIKKISLKDKTRNKTIVTLRFARDEDGFRIYCKSPVLETYFKRISNNTKYEEEYEWNGFIGYQAPALSRSRDLSRAFDNWHFNDLFTGSNIPNLSWMKSIGIKDGITFIFSDRPIHSDDYKTFVEQTLKIVERFYNEYIRPKATTGKITSKLSGDI